MIMKLIDMYLKEIENTRNLNWKYKCLVFFIDSQNPQVRPQEYDRIATTAWKGADATRESPGIGRRVGPETSALVAAGHDYRAIF